MKKDIVPILIIGLRKLGDSNPRYGNPYGSLANCWFQPLTQTSSKLMVAHTGIEPVFQP